MRRWVRFSDWQLRSKMAALIVIASVVPLTIAGIVDLTESMSALKKGTFAILEARCEQLRDKLDTFHLGYQHSVERSSHMMELVNYDGTQEIRQKIRARISIWPKSDNRVRCIAVLDGAGKIIISTEDSLVGRDLSSQPYIQQVLKGKASTSDVHIIADDPKNEPIIVYAAPVLDPDGKTARVVSIWVKAKGFWDVAKTSNGLAGDKSYAVIFDNEGIRVGHTSNEDSIFHPAGPLDPVVKQKIVSERRFGPKTEELLSDVHAFPEQFERSRSRVTGDPIFRGISPVLGTWSYGAAMKSDILPWTIFYMVPESTINMELEKIARERIFFGLAIILVAVLMGGLVVRPILGPVQSLSRATKSIAAGDLSTRVQESSRDELGQLGQSFNSMADQIEAQAKALQTERDELEVRVEARTADLLETTRSLESEIGERARAEKAVAASQHLLQSIVENAPSIIYVKDIEGRYLLANRLFCELFGVEKTALIGRTDYDLFSKEMSDAFRATDRLVASAGKAIVEEDVGHLADGTHYYLSVKSPLLDEQGVAYATFGISTDVTELKHAEETLRASEERTKLIVETALDAVVTIDEVGDVTGWNSQAEKIFGFTWEDVVGRQLADIIIPDRYRDLHRAGLQKYLATGEATVLNRRIELRALHQDGHEFSVELSITPIRSGSKTEFSAFIRDITEQKLAESKVRAQLERLNLLHHITRATGERQDLKSIFQVVVRSLEDQLPVDFCCVCLYEPLDNMLTVTSIGIKSEHISTDLSMIENEQIPIDENGLSTCVRGRLVYEPDISDLNFPFPERLSKGGLGSLVLAPLLVESQVFGVLVTARIEPNSFSSGDCEFLRQLSEHVALSAHQARLHDALQVAYNDLRQTQQAVMQQERLKALGQMASGIAHDINNAISPVALYTESLLANERDLSPRARDYLETIARSIDDVAATVARMREFYRQREPQLTLSPVPLNRLVQEVVDLTKARWSDMALQRGIKIDVRLELAADLAPVMGIESEIREMLTNLVFNAVDAMPEGGTLTIQTQGTEISSSEDGTAARPGIEIAVTDTGIGMDEETQRRCLEPFFTTKGERGTGLGMAMVYGVAQRHGATMDITSELGKGTTVKVIFDRVSSEGSGQGSVVWEASILDPIRILLIDDDPLLLKSLRDTLEGQGHIVTVANGGQAGIDTFTAAADRGQPFAVVFTDLGMPYVDGRKVASAIKSREQSTFVILLTGWGQRLIADGDIPNHVDYVLNKPPKLRDIHEALVRSLEPGRVE